MATPGTLYRTEDSTVVVLKSGEYLELRRGNLRGKAIPDRRTWTSKEEWFASLGNICLVQVEEPTKKSNEEIYVAKIAQQFKSSLGRASKHTQPKTLLKDASNTLYEIKRPTQYTFVQLPDSFERVWFGYNKRTKIGLVGWRGKVGKTFASIGLPEYPTIWCLDSDGVMKPITPP